MRYTSQQIGWSQEAKLLYDILKKLDELIKVTNKIVTTLTTTTIP